MSDQRMTALEEMASIRWTNNAETAVAAALVNNQTGDD
jgi:hypothetical protein